MAMLQNIEPAKKRSKLVLPEPQISDQELQQVVKLGRASEIAKEVASESGIETTDALLADYSITPQIAATPRTPAPFTDRIMQEAQTIMALTHVETPLKGGVNTPLHETNFASVLPQSVAMATPNTVLATPFRSARAGDGSSTPGFQTPGSALVPVGHGAHFGSFTPILVRDKLNINTEDDASVTETPIAYKNYQKQIKDSLREKLATLPTPRNDYEIVVPEDESDNMESTENDQAIEDQADVDARIVAEEKAIRKAELARRSHVIQRELPRPLDINTTILRPLTDMQGLTELQKAEELIKQEMITMLHYDALLNPVVLPAGAPSRKPNALQQLQVYLEQNPYDEFEEEDLSEANKMMIEEMHTVKSGMGHGDLSLENYSQVWQECLSQVLYLPSQNRYTRANLASKKDRFESAERKLEQNRRHMAKEAKRCGKIEKKLKILTGGYQVSNQTIIACTETIKLILLFLCYYRHELKLWLNNCKKLTSKSSRMV